MAASGKRKKMLHIQAEALVKAIEENPILVRHSFSGPEGQALKRSIWTSVAKKLNSLGPSKNWCQWKQTWKDLKAKTRKLVAMRAREKQTNPKAHIQIPALERRVLAIMLAKEENVDVPYEVHEGFRRHEEDVFESSQDARDDDSVSVKSEASDQPIKRRNPTKCDPNAIQNAACSVTLERLLTENNRQLKDMVDATRDISTTLREMASNQTVLWEELRSLSQAAWSIARSLPNVLGVAVGQIQEDYGEEPARS